MENAYVTYLVSQSLMLVLELSVPTIIVEIGRAHV